jgi:rod shape-determining protein MreB
VFHLRSLLGLVSSDLAIDLGTTNTLVFAKDRGIVVNEPSLVARNSKTGEFEAFGREAFEMLGRTPANIESIRPLKDGVIANFEAAQAMLDHFIRKAHGKSRLVSPCIVIGVPSSITQVEKRAVRDSVYGAKASEVFLVEEAMAAALGAGLPIEDPSGNVIVDVGGGTTDIAVISLAGIVWSASTRVAGNAMDESIINHVRRRYNLLIGERTAETVKMRIGSAYPLEEPTTMEISGRDLVQGVPRTQLVSDEEIREALSESVQQIVELVRTALQNTPPELSADIVDRGIILTGGGSLLTHLDKYLREVTGLPVSYADDALASVVLGVGRLLQDRDLLKKVAIESW